MMMMQCIFDNNIRNVLGVQYMIFARVLRVRYGMCAQDFRASGWTRISRRRFFSDPIKKRSSDPIKKRSGTKLVMSQRQQLKTHKKGSNALLL
jgi:hypothetical protein